MAHEHFYVKRSERESLVQPELIYTGLLEDAPNWFNIQHSHDFCEILYVAGGAGEAILEGKKFRLAPGDLVVVNPGTLHEERSDAKAPLRLIFLAIRDFAVPGLPAGCLSQEKYRVLSCGEYRYKIGYLFTGAFAGDLQPDRILSGDFPGAGVGAAGFGDAPDPNQSGGRGGPQPGVSENQGISGSEFYVSHHAGFPFGNGLYQQALPFPFVQGADGGFSHQVSDLETDGKSLRAAVRNGTAGF